MCLLSVCRLSTSPILANRFIRRLSRAPAIICHIDVTADKSYYEFHKYGWINLLHSLCSACRLVFSFNFLLLEYSAVLCSPHYSGSINSEILVIQTGDYGPC